MREEKVIGTYTQNTFHKSSRLVNKKLFFRFHMSQAIGFILVLVALTYLLPHSLGMLDEFLVALFSKVIAMLNALSVHSISL